MPQFPEIGRLTYLPSGSEELVADDSGPTRSAQPTFNYVERPALHVSACAGEDPAATTRAVFEFTYRDVSAHAAMAERHTPQLLDTAVFGGGAVGFVAGPLLTARWTPASLPPHVLLLICLLEVLGLISGMVIYRARRKER